MGMGSGRAFVIYDVGRENLTWLGDVDEYDGTGKGEVEFRKSRLPGRTYLIRG